MEQKANPKRPSERPAQTRTSRAKRDSFKIDDILVPPTVQWWGLEAAVHFAKIWDAELVTFNCVPCKHSGFTANTVGLI
jgi:hypothetical protein